MFGRQRALNLYFWTTRRLRLKFPIYIAFYVSIVLYGSQGFSWWMWTPGDTVDNSSQSLFVEGYRPDQPILFSHKLHAGELKMSCNYCHHSARRSPVAGVPPTNTCMGCHKLVNIQAEPIKYLTEKYNKNEPIEWVRVHDLPDFVRFSHQVHVNAKGLDGKALLECQSCHGPVESMTIVEQWAPLQMGWCIDCHNKVKVPAQGKKPAETYAPVSCNTCHY